MGLDKIIFVHLQKFWEKRNKKRSQLNTRICFRYRYPTEIDDITFDFEFSPWLTAKDLGKSIKIMCKFIDIHREVRNLPTFGWWKFQYDRKDQTWYDTETGDE